MRLAIPSDDQQTLAQHLGRCRGFMIVDVEDGQVTGREYRPNTITGHAMGPHQIGHDDGGHAGRHARIIDNLTDCQALVAGGMGQRIHQDLAAAGISAYTTGLRTIDEVIEALAEGGLEDDPERRCDHDHEREHHH